MIPLARARGTAVLAAIVGSWLLTTACSGGGDDSNESATPPFIPTVECVEASPSPAPGSVTAQCGSISGAVVSVDLVATDVPPTEEVVAAVAAMRFTQPGGPFVLTLEGCTPGSALGNPADLVLDCAVAQSNPSELLVGVSRKGTGPGVTISGSQTLVTLTFRASGVGASSLQFLLPNTLTGSALLRQNASDPGVLEVIGGLSFSGASITGM